ncbi:MAG TPA: hypothetical protein VNG32_02765 [Candidatus Dormibacteraeota bacterium]|nr:hypothetical protein [Candidatus Dormibacteraeota bacterium]
MARIYGLLGLSLGTALFFFGVPALLTNDTHTLKYTYFLADLFAQVAIQVEVWLLWFIGLRTNVKLRNLLAVTVPFSIVLLSAQLLTSFVTISTKPSLVIYTDKPLVLVLKSIIYMAIALPIGYFFLRQIPNQPSGRAKAKTLFSGLIFIILSSAATSNNILDKGSDTTTSATILGVFFALFLIVNLLPRAKPAPAVKR